MARVIVVGGGFAGLSAAARLAKLRHQVAIVEESSELGGRLRGHRWHDHDWQLYPDSVTLPGVFRDLFRKSGRQLDRVLDLVPCGPRRHVFAQSGEVLDLPFGTRGEQHDAIVAALGQDLWSDWLDSLGPRWDALRRRLFDEVYDGELEAGYRRLLRPRRSLRTEARQVIGDRRLQTMVLDAVRLCDDLPAHTPAYTGVWHYVERNFGRWRFAGGMPALADALEHRMTERKVEVRRTTSATDVRRAPNGRIDGVMLESGEQLSAEVVVWCAPDLPASMSEPALGRRIPAQRSLLMLDEPVDLPEEVVVHHDQPIRLWRSGPVHWVVQNHTDADPLATLAAAGIDLRDRIADRCDLSSHELCGFGHDGWTWRGWRSVLERPGVGEPRGLYFAGAHAHPGSSPELIGLATAAIAEDVGQAPRERSA